MNSIKTKSKMAAHILKVPIPGTRDNSMQHQPPSLRSVSGLRSTTVVIVNRKSMPGSDVTGMHLDVRFVFTSSSKISSYSSTGLSASSLIYPNCLLWPSFLRGHVHLVSRHFTHTHQVIFINISLGDSIWIKITTLRIYMDFGLFWLFELVTNIINCLVVFIFYSFDT